MLRLWKKDVVLLTTVGVVVAAVAVISERFLGARAWIATIGVTAALLVGILLDVYRRLQVQMKEAFQGEHEYLKATYHQIEALLSVINTIRPTSPLPSTRTWSASPDILNHLCKLVLTHRPSLVFEIGSGVSTLITAYCLRRLGSGRIVSLESDSTFAAATRQMLVDHNLSDLVTVVDAPLKKIDLGTERWQWYDVDRIPSTPQIDLLFVDGPPGSVQPLARYPALPVLSSRLAPTALVVLDDGARPDEKGIIERWNREFGMSSEYLHMEKGAYVLTRR